MKLLIVYGTRNGQTKRIAERLGKTLRERGAEVELIDGREVPAGLALESYDGVIAGASINNGKFQPCLGAFVDAFRERLRPLPTAFFSVSLAEADPSPRVRGEAQKTLDRFLAGHCWQPLMTARFAGALPPSRYRLIVRLLWRGLDKRREEFTDWSAVARFAESFLAKADRADARAA
jgi:menaquinone-dependent protoporphyrinogen oxidase